MLDLRRQTLEVPGQEILTRDKVTVRVNLSAVYQIVDPVTARSAREGRERASLPHAADRGTADARRSARSKSAGGQGRHRRIGVGGSSPRDGEYGVRVGEIALKDIVLPGDIRDILNQVVTAEKQAQANLIRRREETAATRSLLNTAKLMEDNPLLVRLKELETLEKVAEQDR